MLENGSQTLLISSQNNTRTGYTSLETKFRARTRKTAITRYDDGFLVLGKQPDLIRQPIGTHI